ncbi:class I SAM-dependent methyltransferase [Yinghuangia sp. ASG 101]|uniref:class I SAM-dependent methyltransferase n=1 Tax=Yinghuangia sp. ASG 101 TaxID=2896848 RepID=UPI001E6188AA|nr:class I SAM-dependent methyltransferase [Yinghuangia sp. ASG 101]UGQ10021.1 class I SAM-dependent methyltransferase [Yinghuangia sp. ASG 101]
MRGEDAEQAALVAEFWDGEYVAGRLADLPPDDFVADILAAARRFGLVPGSGLYIGPGTGRNYFPLVAGGLDLVGLDISAVGLDAIRARTPERSERLVCGSLDDLPAGRTYPVVIGLHVFHHGTRDFARAHIRSALDRVAPGGLFCVRVAAVGARASRPHEVVGHHEDGSVTLRYLQDDPATPGMYAHFFGEEGLRDLLAGFETVVPLSADDIDPATGERGPWRRWDAIVRRPVAS